MKKLREYIDSSIAELKKVVWPTQESVIASTKVVLASTLFAAIFFGLVDYLLSLGVKAVF